MPDQINDYGLNKRSRPIEGREDFVGWLDGLLDGLKLSSVDLLGFSYGGGLSAVYAIAHPERVRRLVLLAPACRDMPTRAKPILAAILQNTFRTRCTATRYIYWERAEAVKKNEETHRVVDDMIDELILSRKCFAPHKWVLPFPIKPDGWSGMRMPCLFIVGEDDIFLSAHRAVRCINSSAPQIETRIIKDAGHDLLIVKPEEVCEEVARFLSC